MKRSIFIFNPETDYALAAGRSHYNPPAAIIKLQKCMQLVQVWQASEEDVIVVASDFNPALYSDQMAIEILESKKIKTVTIDKLSEYMNHYPDIEWEISPWGWNHTIRSLLIESGIKEKYLKTDKEIDMLRQLAHRRTVIPFQKVMQSLLPSHEIKEALEFLSSEEALEFAKIQKDVFFKAPWSSSGRGLLRITTSLSNPTTEIKLKEWLNGCIRRQGSVMGEIAYNRKEDFASEWNLDNGKADFLGLSLFNTNNNGKYLNNSDLSQKDIYSRLASISPFWSENILEAQRIALETLIAPFYSGPTGIDMLADTEGHINPCVEINLRTTMGIIELYRINEKISL